MAARILIVEDNALNMTLLNDVLQAEGYATFQAGSGREAVERARAEAPDLVLMDIRLPDMSGLDAMAGIRAEPSLARVSVVAVTALAMAGDEERLRAAGCDGYVAKPVSVETLLETVAGFVGAPNEGEEGGARREAAGPT